MKHIKLSHCLSKWDECCCLGRDFVGTSRLTGCQCAEGYEEGYGATISSGTINFKGGSNTFLQTTFDCAALCDSEPSCRSYEYSFTTGNCLLNQIDNCALHFLIYLVDLLSDLVKPFKLVSIISMEFAFLNNSVEYNLAIVLLYARNLFLDFFHFP